MTEEQKLRLKELRYTEELTEEQMSELSNLAQMEKMEFEKDPTIKLSNDPDEEEELDEQEDNQTPYEESQG